MTTEQNEDHVCPYEPLCPTCGRVNWGAIEPVSDEGIALDRVATIVRLVPHGERPTQEAAIEVCIEGKWVEVISGDYPTMDDLHADLGWAIEEGLAEAVATITALSKQIEGCERSMIRQTETFDAENNRLEAALSRLSGACERLKKHARHASTCPQLPVYYVVSQTHGTKGEGPCTCGLTEALALSAEDTKTEQARSASPEQEKL